MTRIFFAASAALCLLLGSARAQPTSIPAPASVQSLSKRAEIIVIGEIEQTQSAWNPERTVIWTQVDVRVHEVLKGVVEAGRLRFFQIGGQVGDRKSQVAGAPVFAGGEQVLLFLSRRRQGTLGVIDISQGAFRVESDSSGQPMAVRRGDGSTGIPERIPLEEIRGQIHMALEAK